MELKAFVTAVLTEIIDGVKDAQREAEHARDGEENLCSRPIRVIFKGKDAWFRAGDNWYSR